MKTKLTQRRIKARKSSACAMFKPWKKGRADKKPSATSGRLNAPGNNFTKRVSDFCGGKSLSIRKCELRLHSHNFAVRRKQKEKWREWRGSNP
jgi:hypothetical protein